MPFCQAYDPTEDVEDEEETPEVIHLDLRHLPQEEAPAAIMEAIFGKM